LVVENKFALREAAMRNRSIDYFKLFICTRINASRLWSCALILCLFFASSVSAQICAGGYDRNDRAVVVAQDTQADYLLSRMADVAELSANGVFSVTQRLALLNEFEALRAALGTFGDSDRNGVSGRTNQFLGAVIDANYLGLASLTVIGGTIEESQSNARIALDGVNLARAALKTCLWGSWERHPIVGSPNDGVCAGGYSPRDFLQVQRQINAARGILNRMRQLAYKAANGAFSVSQRNLLNFDFEYLREDLDILGSRYRPFASSKTNQFLSTLIDPVFLGLMTSTLSGQYILEAQDNARAALAAIGSAFSTLSNCSSIRPRGR